MKKNACVCVFFSFLIASNDNVGGRNPSLCERLLVLDKGPSSGAFRNHLESVALLNTQLIVVSGGKRFSCKWPRSDTGEEDGKAAQEEQKCTVWSKGERSAARPLWVQAVEQQPSVCSYGTCIPFREKRHLQ